MTWDENKHPRDNEGKFTFKYGSNSDSSQDGTPVLKGRAEKADKVEKTEKTDKGSLDRVLDGIDFSEIKDILYDVISTSLPSIVKVGLTVAQMKNTIKAYNLENEVIKKIENIKTKDKERDNHLSSKTSLSDYSKNKRHGNKERPTDILYHSSNIKEQQRLKESEYKSRLLDILGNRATNADVLYSKPEELERKIKEYGLADKLNKLKQKSADEFNNFFNTINNSKILKETTVFAANPKEELKNITTDKLSDFIKAHPEFKKNILNFIPSFLSSWFIGEFYNNDLYELAQKAYGENTAGMLDLAHQKINNLSYVKDTIKLNNCNDPKVIKYVKYLKTKIEKQFKDYENINPENVNGYYFKSNSNPSKELSQTKEIKEFIKKHKKEIMNNTLFNDKEYHSIEFSCGDWYYAIHYADIIDTYFDNDSNLHVILVDTYDFNANENPLIEAGRDAMKRGILKPRFLVWDILIHKVSFDKI